MYFYKLLERRKIMNFDRVKGILIQEFFITIRSYEVILDIFVFPVMSVILFGFLANYLTGASGESVAHSLLAGMLLWQFIFIVQYSVSVGSLWNIWARNLSNMFITPLTLSDYLFSQTVSGVFKAFCVFIPSAFLSIAIFNFNIFQLGFLNIFLYIVNLIFFASSIGIIILGLIFRFGTRIQAFAWGFLPIIQPLAAAFYPISVLPAPLRILSYALPPSYIFEAIRKNFSGANSIDWSGIGLAFGLNVIYFLSAIFIFKLLFKESKRVGQFARLEG